MNARLRGLARRPWARPIAKAVVPLAIVAVLASDVIRPATPGPTSSPGASQVAAASQSSPTSQPGVPAGPTPTPEPWEALDLDPVVETASIAPERVDSAGVATTSRFTVRSLNATPAATLAAGVRVDPPIEFRIVDGAAPDEAILEPVSPLVDGTTYRLILETPDGSLGGSWAFRTQRPLHIVGTIPGDLSTGVPIDTGIEVTFDQDGTTGLDSHFRIEPAVAGRFKQHGRTWAFVPSARLALATVYRVTVDPGVRIAGSDQELETGVTFQFETSPDPARREWTVQFAGPMAAIRPAQQPSLPLFGNFEDEDLDEGVERPKELPVRIFRLPDLATTFAVAARLTGPTSWLQASRGGLVDTSDLVRVASLDAPLVLDREYVAILQIPIRLDPGAYLVVIPRQGRSAQLLLQVGTLSAYAVTSETDVVAWVNDLATVRPIIGAKVALRGGKVLGSTDATGMARFAMPDELRPSPAVGWEIRPSLVSITAPNGRWIVAGLGSPVSWLDGRYDNLPSGALETRNRWWLLFNTDRSMYRQTDVIHAWGMVRSRDDGTVPAEVELRLRPTDSEAIEAAAAIERIVVSPNPRGVFVADVMVRGLPRASYALDMVVDGQVVESRWVDVTEIRKPSYQLTVEADRHAFLDGESISVRVQAEFFDGSTLPQIELRVDSDPDAFTTTVTTDATGSARFTVPARFYGSEPAGWSSQSISVTPVRPEEGEISGSTDVVVFPSTAWLSATSALDGTTLVVNGTLRKVDFAAINTAYSAEDWAWPDGDYIARGPVAGRPISATVVRWRNARTQTGQHYDYLEKRVVTTWSYDQVETTLGTYRATTGTDGSFRIAITVPSATDEYAITVDSSDAAGRRTRNYTYASPPVRPVNAERPPYLVDGGCGGWFTSMTVGLGEDATVTLHNGDGSPAQGGRFLFLVADRGIREATLGAGSTFSRTLTLDDLPGFTIRAIQVTGEGYATADASVRVDSADLAISVQLRPDRQRYAPGDRVSVEVTTLGPDGRPVDADVVVQGVDEKLFAIGAASESDVLRELHVPTDAGFLQSFTSHRIPMRTPGDGCGATGGGRDAFGDVVTFQLVRTGADGRATVSFDLLDDLTSWHLTALAMSGGVRAGSSSVLIPVSLPFFVEAVLAPEYLVGETPVLRARGYGDSLRAGDAVRFTISAPSLGIEETTITGQAFDAVRFPLPALPAGNHRIRIAATRPGTSQSDAVIRTIHVTESRVAGLVKRYDMLTADFVPQGGEGLSSYTILDAGRGALLSELLDLATAQSARFDKGAAATIARQILIDEYGFTDDDLPSPGFDASRYEQFGIAILPYASRDPELTALAALIVPDLIDVNGARSYLRDYADADEATSEARVMMLAGLAGLGDDVLEELRALIPATRSVRESLWLALGLAAVGDEHAARTIERDVLEIYGRRFGPWVRLEVGTGIEDTLDAARLLLVLSARLGEPFAGEVRQYLLDHPSRERAVALEELAYIQAAFARLPRAAGRFAWSIDGERHEVELAPGRGLTLVLTASQRATFKLETLAGVLAVVSSWTGNAADVPSRGPVTITRVISPASNATDAGVVRIRITIDFGALATDECWQITDLAPSGLAPIERTWEWDDDSRRDIGRPWQFDGQRVSWCASPDDSTRVFEYAARVVSPGTYRWEPTIVQSVMAPEVGSATSGSTYTIR